MNRRRALFLDRDGVINHDTGHTHRIEDFRFRDGIFELCATALSAGFALVVVTNQAGIGRGYYTEADFAALTAWMLARFGDRGIRFAGVEHCPFHPTAGIGPYRVDSPRRKPAPGMILDACARHGLDPACSAMVGDRATDMRAALSAGVGTRILLAASPAEAEAAPPGTIILPEGDLDGAAAIVAGLAA
jgi:D-glycero-D-manno-heptose 1,7-bisphosphate phosphatase